MQLNTSSALVAAGGRVTAVYRGSNVVYSLEPVAPATGLFLGSQPQDATAVNGQAQFVTSATEAGGGTVSYQWQRKPVGGSFADIAGETSATLSLTGMTSANDGDQYRAVITGSSGQTITTREATLTAVFTETAVVLSSPPVSPSAGTYPIPAEATHFKAWAVGGGGWQAGGVAYKTFSVTPGLTEISYTLGLSANSASVDRGNNTTVSYAGSTVTGNGGGEIYFGGFSGGEGGASGGDGGNYYPFKWLGGASNGSNAEVETVGWLSGNLNDAAQVVSRRPPRNVSGLFEAVELAGNSLTQSQSNPSPFGYGAVIDSRPETLQRLGAAVRLFPGIGGGGGPAQGEASAIPGGRGAVVLRFWQQGDGPYWTERALPSGSWDMVAYGGGRFVAIDQFSGATAISGNGRTWSLGGAIDNSGTPVWQSIAYGNGRFVAAQQSYRATSIDGTSWTRSSSTGGRSVFFVNDRFVGVGAGADAASSRQVHISTNGLSWVTYSDALPAMPTGAGDRGYWQGVAYGAGQYVAIAMGYIREGSAGVTAANIAATSSDGVAWTLRTLPGTSTLWRGLAYGNGKFVATGGDRRAAISTDGVTWSKYDNALPASTGGWSLSFGNGKFVAISGASTAVSADGITWTYHNPPGGASSIAAFGNGIFVSVRDSAAVTAAF